MLLTNASHHGRASECASPVHRWYRHPVLRMLIPFVITALDTNEAVGMWFEAQANKWMNARLNDHSKCYGMIPGFHHVIINNSE